MVNVSMGYSPVALSTVVISRIHHSTKERREAYLKINTVVG